MRLRIVSVNPANNSPSIAKTSPIAAPKSRMSLRHLRFRRTCSRPWRRRRGGRGRSRRRRGGPGRRRREIAEEVGLRAQDRSRIAAFETVVIGLHRPIKSEEVRVGAERLRENPIAFAVALATDPFGLLLRGGDRDGHLAVGFGLDLLTLLRALRTIGCRALLTIGLHA